MHFRFSKQMAEECVQAHPCSKFSKFDDHGGTLKGILERGEAVLRQPFRRKTQENEARASSQKACSGHTWLSRFLRVSVSWQGQRAEGNSNDDRGVVGDDLLAGIGDAPACSSFHPGRRGPQERVTIC